MTQSRPGFARLLSLVVLTGLAALLMPHLRTPGPDSGVRYPPAQVRCCTNILDAIYSGAIPEGYRFERLLFDVRGSNDEWILVDVPGYGHSPAERLRVDIDLSS